jgi:hypothetical protein
MRKHQHKGISVYTEHTKTIKVHSIVIYRHQNKVETIKTAHRATQQAGYNSYVLS